MIDSIDAAVAIFNVVVSAGFVAYSWKLVSYHSIRSLMGKTWVHMFIAGVILFAISMISSAQILQMVILPVWWRNASAAVFQVYLLIAVIAIFHSWKNLGNKI